MLDNLNKINKDIKIIDVNSPEFKTFGRVITDLDTTEITEVAEKIERPENGSLYQASVPAFERLKISELITNEFYGTLKAQIGYCHGHSNFLNATEWHKGSEINIAITPLVLILGHVWDIEDGKIDSSKFTAFYLPKGTVVEVYETTLHFCPCEVESTGFGCVVGLPLGTNTDLEIEVKDKKIFRKNKWIICHENNEALIGRGVVPGITGINYEIKY
ncbi:MAG: DUF4867 family protein [Clostridia bacterium]|nr:DUF4867 family protein [Clostridia bacterium]